MNAALELAYYQPILPILNELNYLENKETSKANNESKIRVLKNGPYLVSGNVPLRKIGKSTLNSIEKFAIKKKMTFIEAFYASSEINTINQQNLLKLKKTQQKSNSK